MSETTRYFLGGAMCAFLATNLVRYVALLFIVRRLR